MRLSVDTKIGKEEMGVFIHVAYVYAKSATCSRETTHMMMVLKGSSVVEPPRMEEQKWRLEVLEVAHVHMCSSRRRESTAWADSAGAGRPVNPNAACPNASVAFA